MGPNSTAFSVRLRVEQPETIRFNTCSRTTRDGDCHEETHEDEVDAFVVRYPPEESPYWMDIEDATGQRMRLRFSAEPDHPWINWAEAYGFGGQTPN